MTGRSERVQSGAIDLGYLPRILEQEFQSSHFVDPTHGQQMTYTK